ncbi:SurA N-terminal domain-containing protein [Sinimarinibacterium sp. NLF-5-8]|uniref:SurA N-terminal domain-containing protein n=1 Tax=Sinimarinibacterium sp. NLF-5-8 TaxID=2698684 RepID=UPI00137B989D|nr:SurA N-terminal domain-containing protein [Sinimarinibacterium sp. NLF-5-8]QHS09218.1 hypothetical protein GT972_02965 [Sinimarinibacterium sp. NLF-5-8]
MLQQIRDRTSGLIAGFVVALVSVPFAFWGIDSFNSGGGDPVVAKVGDQKIHDSQFRQQYDQRYQQLVQLMGDNFRADLLDKNRLREAVLRDMTQESMLRQYTQKRGFYADDATLFDALSNEPAFQRDGRFDPEAYRDALMRVGFSSERYEAQLRSSIEMNQMRGLLVDTAFSVPAQREQLARLQGQRRTLQYAVFEPGKYHDRVKVSDEDIAADYDKTHARYMAPERLRLDYVELSLDALPPAAQPADDILKPLYEAEREGRFASQEQRKASHILIGFGADKAAAREKAEALIKQLAEGADFAQLAKENSEDPGSRDRGGDLGWIRRGQMVKGFEDALFALDKGATSAVVETEFGWHVIHLDDLKPAQVRPFDDPQVHAELVTLYENRERQQRFQEMSDRLEQLAFENADSLAPVAEALGLKLETTDWFERGKGSGVAANDAVLSVAFSPELLQDGENSKPIALSPTALVVIRKNAYEAPRQRPLEEVREQVREALIHARATELAAQEAQEVLNALAAGTPFQEIVSAKRGELRNPGQITRQDDKVEAPILAEAFRMTHPAEGKLSYGQTTLSNGAHAVLVLSAVEMPDAAALKSLAQAQQQTLKAHEGGLAFASYMQVIEDRVGVKLMLPAADTTTPEEP